MPKQSQSRLLLLPSSERFPWQEIEIVYKPLEWNHCIDLLIKQTVCTTSQWVSNVLVNFFITKFFTNFFYNNFLQLFVSLEPTPVSPLVSQSVVTLDSVRNSCDVFYNCELDWHWPELSGCHLTDEEHACNFKDEKYTWSKKWRTYLHFFQTQFYQLWALSPLPIFNMILLSSPALSSSSSNIVIVSSWFY